MPRLDFYHDTVRHALEKDGWHITYDPFVLSIGKKRLFVDLGAETLLSAEKAQCKIAVEIKSFTGASDIHDLEQALGQYVLYQQILLTKEPERRLYLAVSVQVVKDIFAIELGQLLLNNQVVRVVVFDPEQEEITQWLPD